MGIFFSKSTSGFYRDDLHGNAMPADVKPISEERYHELLAGMVANKPIVADADGFPMNLERTVDIGERIALQRHRIDAAYEQAMALIAGAYPRAEVNGWPEQVKAVELFEAAPDAPNPLLEALAQSSQCSLAEMAGRIRGKRESYLVAYGSLTARRHALLQQLREVDPAAADAEQQVAALDTAGLMALAKQLQQ